MKKDVNNELQPLKDRYNNALREPCSCGEKAGVPAANGTIVLLPPAGPPPEWGRHSSGCGKQIRAQVCVRVHVCA